MAGVPHSMLEATIDGLRRHPPYDGMDRASLEYLVAHLTLAYYPKGAKLVAPEQGAVQKVHVIQRGRAHGAITVAADGSEGPDPHDVVEYANGDTFPLAAIMAKRPVRHTYIAVEDTFCYEADAGVVEALAQRSPQFQAYCTGRVTALLQQSYALLQAQYSRRSSSGQSLGIALRDLVRRAPLYCGPDELLGSALATMHRAKIGSIVIVDAAGAPAGIFTERDLLRLAASSQFEAGQPIGACMTPSPYCLPDSATAAEAAVLMVRMGIRHVVVVNDGRLAGVVSERDLFSMQRNSMRGIVQSLDNARGAADLVQAAADIRELAANLLAQGVAAEQLIQFIATLNDRLCGRVIDLEAQRRELSGLRFCWIALGSEGRLEQTLATDQDNGIIFAADAMAPDEVRTRLLPFAQAVNATLDQCGFPLCKGDIMAGNPHWCLSVEEWKAIFGNWIRNPLPQALLHSNIFYDFRSVWGDEALAHGLREWLAGELRDNQRFLRAMTANAMDARPPLGLLRDFVTSGKGVERHTIDLKAEGVRPFVDAARILALASGTLQTNTAMRLREAGERLHTPAEEIEAMVDAFHFIQLLRLRHQHHESRQDEQKGEQQDDQRDANPNRIDPDALNELDRRILKEAFRQARKLQRRLALDYQL